MLGYQTQLLYNFNHGLPTDAQHMQKQLQNSQKLKKIEGKKDMKNIKNVKNGKLPKKKKKKSKISANVGIQSVLSDDMSMERVSSVSTTIEPVPNDYSKPSSVRFLCIFRKTSGSFFS